MHSGINKAKTCTVHRWVSLPERTCFPAKKIKSWKNIKVELCAAELCAGGSCFNAANQQGLKSGQRQQHIVYLQQGRLIALINGLLFLRDTCCFSDIVKSHEPQVTQHFY